MAAVPPRPSPSNQQQDDGRLNPGGRPRTLLGWIALGAGTGAAALAIGPGVEIDLQLFRLSAHDPLPLLVLALTTLVIHLAWRRRLAISVDVPAMLADVRRRAPVAAAGIAAGLLAIALIWNTWTVGGSDSHCYAAQARTFARGATHLRQPLALAAPWEDATRTFAPVGFLPSSRVPGEFVPVCAPGYPLLVAPVIAAAPALQFLVAPAAAAVLVVAAFVFTRRLCDEPLAAVAAAALCAGAPVVLFQSMQPMTDVPAAAALSAAAALALGRPPRPIAAGLALGVCLVIRPNLLPVTLPFLLWTRARSLRFLATLVPVAAVVPALNTVVYGAPWATGYGDAAALFSLERVPTNLWRYSSWALETMTPMVALGIAAPWVMRRARWPVEQCRYAFDLLALVIVVIACYAAYVTFDAWWYLRFLLPALPAVCALTAAAVFALMTPARRIGAAAAFLTVVAVAALSVREARRLLVFDLWRNEQRLTATAEYLGRDVPQVAAIAIQANGAISYHLYQPVVSWDSLPAERLETAIDWLRRRGFHPLIVVDQDEEQQFRQRFSPHTVVGALDWPPSAVVYGVVRIFDPADRGRFLAGEPVAPTFVDPPRR
jgi:hypothetical protein